MTSNVKLLHRQLKQYRDRLRSGAGRPVSKPVSTERRKPKSNVRQVIISNRIFIDKELVKANAIKQRYKIQMYDEAACARCKNFENRHNDLCDQCPSFGGIYNLHKSVELEGRTYWSVPIGDIQHVSTKLIPDREDVKVLHKYKKVYFDNKIVWTGKLYSGKDRDEDGNPRPNQIELVNKWLEKKNGIIRARPRSGKTVMAVNIVCEIGMKTLILCDRIDLLRQFRRTFTGSRKHKKFPMTNVPELENKVGFSKVVKIIRSMDDFKWNPDVALMTYQTFLNDPSRIQKYINGNYPMLVVDEVHGFNADKAAQIIGLIESPYRLALSATTERKDGREILMERLIGPVVATSKAHTLVPRIMLMKSGVAPPTDYQSWHYCMKWAVSSAERNIEIMKALFKDLRAGHKCIIVPVFWKEHLNALQDLIMKQAKFLAKHKGEKWPLDLVVPFHSGVNRKAALDRADSGKPCIVIAINSMIKQGIDLSMPTKLHLVIPTSARAEVGAPMFRQLSYRTSTPMPGKREPEVAVWVDEMSLFKGCVNGLFWNEIVPGLKKDNFMYRISDADFKAFAGLKTRSSSNRGISKWA